MNTPETLYHELRQLASPENAKLAMRYFKTGPGQYGEGDSFVGISVPMLRTLAKRWQTKLSLQEISGLLQSKEHEYRALALILLVEEYRKGNQDQQQAILNLYLKHTTYINNWDLVDVSVSSILGEYLWTHSQASKQLPSLLRRFSQSSSLWERRMAIVATHAFIKHAQSQYTFALTTLLLRDTEDLMHKASGWMLREVGKYCGNAVLEEYLKVHAQKMPRTMLRYALEHFAPEKRTRYMSRK